MNASVVNTYVADSSDDELMALSLDEVTTSENYRNLETFQKAQLNKKVVIYLFVVLISLLIPTLFLFNFISVNRVLAAVL